MKGKQQPSTYLVRMFLASLAFGVCFLITTGALVFLDALIGGLADSRDFRPMLVPMAFAMFFTAMWLAYGRGYGAPELVVATLPYLALLLWLLDSSYDSLISQSALEWLVLLSGATLIPWILGGAIGRISR